MQEDDRLATPVWHRFNSDQLVNYFSVDVANGLNQDQVEHQLHSYGVNEIPETQLRSVLSIFLSQFSNFMVIILLVAAVISGVFGELADTITIIVIVMLNSILGFVQEPQP